MPAAGIAPGPPVQFEITITQSWLQRVLGSFRGTVTDDSSLIQQGTGTIRGHAGSRRIRFVKRMPRAFTQSEGRAILLSDRLAELGHPGLPERPGPPIQYTGRFEDSAQASGRWVVRPVHLRVARGLWAPIDGATGTWEMRRID